MVVHEKFKLSNEACPDVVGWTKRSAFTSRKAVYQRDDVTVYCYTLLSSKTRGRLVVADVYRRDVHGPQCSGVVNENVVRDWRTPVTLTAVLGDLPRVILATADGL